MDTVGFVHPHMDIYGIIYINIHFTLVVEYNVLFRNRNKYPSRPKSQGSHKSNITPIWNALWLGARLGTVPDMRDN